MALNFDEFQKVVESAQQADALKTALKRALKKVVGALGSLQQALGEMEAVLTDDYAAPKASVPRRARAPKEATPGTASEAPVKKSGRPKKTAE